MAKQSVPLYLRGVINCYLLDRSITCNIENGTIVVRKIIRGVPQVSVLGSPIWNMGYNLVAAVPVEYHLVRYADDTLLEKFLGLH